MHTLRFYRSTGVREAHQFFRELISNYTKINDSQLSAAWDEEQLDDFKGSAIYNKGN